MLPLTTLTNISKLRIFKKTPFVFIHKISNILATRTELIAMQKTDFQPQPLGICQRLFNFIMNGLLARSLKCETLGQNSASDRAKTSPSTRGQTNSDRAKETSLLLKQDQEMIEKEEDPDVIVEFRHKKGMEQWKQGENMQNKPQHPVKGSKHINAAELKSTGARQRARRKSSIIKAEADERERHRMKDNITNTENASLESMQDAHKKAPVIHIRPHLIVSESNINEKSAKFIESKKAALERADTTA